MVIEKYFLIIVLSAIKSDLVQCTITKIKLKKSGIEIHKCSYQQELLTIVISVKNIFT